MSTLAPPALHDLLGERVLRDGAVHDTLDTGTHPRYLAAGMVAFPSSTVQVTPLVAYCADKGIAWSRIADVPGSRRAPSPCRGHSAEATGSAAEQRRLELVKLDKLDTCTDLRALGATPWALLTGDNLRKNPDKTITKARAGKSHLAGPWYGGLRLL